MNYKLLAIAILVIAPLLAMFASHVSQNMIPGQQTAAVAAPVAAPVAAATPAPAPPPPPMSGPVAGAMMPEAGMPNPLAGQPMVGEDAAQAASPPPPAPIIATPSGILPPYPGQYREPASGTLHLPDGRKVG